MASSGLSASFGYDFLDRRCVKTVNGATTTQRQDGEDLVADITGTGTRFKLQGPKADETLAQYDNSFPNGLYLTPNHVSSTTTLTGPAGWVQDWYYYQPFGQATQSNGNFDAWNPFRFTGQQDDDTGLDYYRDRYYSPDLGRFISGDPEWIPSGPSVQAITASGGAADPFLYCNDNPANCVDPSGGQTVGDDDPVLVPQIVLDQLQQQVSYLFSYGAVKFLLAIGPRPYFGSKLNYLYGRATGDPHNIDRSRAMLRQLQSIGLPDTPANRDYIVNALSDAYYNPGSISEVQPNGNIVRDTLLAGPRGLLKLQSVWNGNRLVTVLIYGGKM